MALEFYNLILDHSNKNPDHPAIIDGDSSISYKELIEQINDFSQALGSLKLNENSKLGLLCLNQKEFLIALLGAFRKGLPVIPLNALLNAETLAFIIKEVIDKNILIKENEILPELQIKNSDIKFENVGFKYEATNDKAIKNICFNIKGNTMSVSLEEVDRVWKEADCLWSEQQVERAIDQIAQEIENDLESFNNLYYKLKDEKSNLLISITISFFCFSLQLSSFFQK